MSDIENREKHYSDERIKDTLFSSATEGADLTAMIIRIYATSCVLLAVIDSYKASSKQKTNGFLRILSSVILYLRV